MGLFSSITKIFTAPAKKAVVAPLRTVPRVASKVIAKAPSVTKQLGTAVRTATTLAAPFAPGPTGLGLSVLTSFDPFAAKQSQTGAQPMGLDLGGILKGVSGIFGGGQNPYFDTIANVAGAAAQFIPASPVTSIAMRPSAPMLPGPRAMAPVGAMVGRSFFNRYPNLANAIQQLRNRGMNVKRSQLWSLLKRFGPELLVTGGLLTAAAVSELMVAGPGRRTMNAANPRALRRAARRIKSFHKMCGTIDLLKGGRRRAPSRSACGTCHRNPCRC